MQFFKPIKFSEETIIEMLSDKVLGALLILKKFKYFVMKSQKEKWLPYVEMIKLLPLLLLAYLVT